MSGHTWLLVTRSAGTAQGTALVSRGVPGVPSAPSPGIGDPMPSPAPAQLAVLLGIKPCTPQPTFEQLFQHVCLSPCCTVLSKSLVWSAAGFLKTCIFQTENLIFKAEGSMQSLVVLILFACLFFLFIPMIFHQCAKKPQDYSQSVLEVK